MFFLRDGGPGLANHLTSNVYAIVLEAFRALRRSGRV